jgi:hypothetical protein
MNTHVASIIDIANLVVAAATSIGIFLVFWQIRETKKDRHLQATLAIYDILGSEDQRELRRDIYLSLPKNPAEFSADILAKVEKVCAAFQRTGLLFSKGFIKKKILLQSYAESAIQSWNKLQPYIEYARKQRGIYYLQDFEKFAKAAEKYWKMPSPD